MTGDSTHGGNVYRAARLSGRPVSRWIDFSASINPLGPSSAALRTLRRSWPGLVHYPDPDCLALRQALAKRWRLSCGQILVGNGSTELIHLLPRALAIRHALLIGPTFSEYARAVAAAGARVSYWHAQRAEGYRPPLNALWDRAARLRPQVDTIVLCNPNSPTGQAVSASTVSVLAREAAKRRVRLLVDETFVEYCADRSVLRQAARSANLLVLRSFTKFYAMPALRLGYLVGAEPLVRLVRSLQPPWSVNMPAQIFAEAALNDRDYERRSLAFMQKERAVFLSGLAAIPGLTCFPSEANFVLLELPASRSAGACAEALAEAGLLVRDCSSVPGLNRRTIRVAVRRPAENRRLLSALRAWLGGIA